MGWQRRQRLDDGVTDGIGGVSARQVQQDRVPARALYQGADGRTPVLADDQVAFPVPGNLTVGRLLRALVDHGHVEQAAAALIGPAMRLATKPAGAQRSGQSPAQATEVGAVDRLVDRLRYQVTVRLVRKLRPQSVGYLFGAPPLLELVLHELAQLNVGDELARLRPGSSLRGKLLRRMRPVQAAVRIDVAA